VVLDHLAEAVSIVAPDGTLAYANAAAAGILRDLHGRADALVRDGDWRALAHDGKPLPDDRLPVEVTRTTGAECTGVEVGFRAQDGHVRWLRISTRRLSGAEPPHGVIASYVDVTEARRTAGRLRETEDRYRRVVESLHEAVIIHDAEGRITAANPRAEQVLGVRAEALAGRTPLDPRWRPVRPDGTPLPTDELPAQRALATGLPQVDELIGVHTPEGDLRWLVVNAVPLPGAGGVAVSFIDVTARHEADRARAISEAHFRVLAESSADVVARVGLDGRYAYVSPAATRVYGRRPEEMTGRPAFEFIHPDDHGTMRRLRRALLRGGPARTMEYRVRHRDGHWIWVEGTITRVPDGDGGAGGLLVSTRDVSERRAQQQALQEANERFARAFDNAPIGMALVGLDGSWLQVNPALCAMVGYSADEMLARRFQDITHPDDLDADVARVHAALAAGSTSYQAEKRYIHADGRIVHVHLAASVVSADDGSPVHLLCHVQDVSERHALEERLRALAERDDLTGLMNRRRFEQELAHQIERCARSGERAVLGLIDLDHFKQVNDTHGHAAGDEVLRAVGLAMGERVRASDVLARLGGDEFALILAGTDGPAAVTAASDLAAAVRARVGGSGVSASIGLTPLLGTDRPEVALRRADAAMYAVKESRRGGIHLTGAPPAMPAGDLLREPATA